MRKNIPTLFLTFAVLFGTSLAAFGQIKEISEQEYLAASDAAWAMTKSSYTYISTWTSVSKDHGERFAVTYHESKDRSYTKSSITSETGSSTSESVRYDGSVIFRHDYGVWESFTFPEDLIGSSQRPNKSTYMLELLNEGGRSYKVYSKGVTLPQYHLKTSTFKVDESGKIIEVTSIVPDKETTTYSYPQQITPIRKPKVGSKENI